MIALSKEDAVAQILSKSGWRVKRGQENMSIGCPLAPYSPLHRSSVDSRPSMGIKVEPGSVLVHCFTCGFKSGQLSFLYRALSHHDPNWQPALQAALEMESNYLIDGINELKSHGFNMSKPSNPKPLEEDVWKPYSRRFCKYLDKRGIDFETGAEWGVGHDKQKHRALIPVRDISGALWGAVGRTYRGEQPKYLNYFDMSKSEHLLGAHMIGDAKSIIIVEGALDAMRAYQALKRLDMLKDYACVSVMGASVSKSQAKRLVAWAHEVLIAFDNDQAGIKGRQSADKALSKLLMVRHIDISKVDKKDFGECSEAQIASLVKSAELSLY